MPSEIATRPVLSLEGLASSADSFSRVCQNSLDIINYVTVTVSLTGLIMRISQPTIFVLFMLILELSFPSFVLFPYPKRRVTQTVNFPCKETGIYTAFLLQKLFGKCLEKKLCNIDFRYLVRKMRHHY